MNNFTPDYHSGAELPPDNTPWKQEVLKSVEQWLENVSADISSDNEINEVSEEEAPDLYSFYAELCVLRSEYQKVAKRNHSFSVQTSDTLVKIENSLAEVTSLAKDKAAIDEHINKDKLIEDYKVNLLRPLTEIMVRFERLTDKLREPPRFSWFSFPQKADSAWKSIAEAFILVKSHLAELLTKEKISRIKAVNSVFDPYTMIAVAVEERDDIPSNIVLEEIKPGFLLMDKVLVLAEVKVAKSKSKGKT